MTSRRADLALLLATAIWGIGFPVVKSALADATPLALLTIRFGAATLLLLPFVPLRPRPGGRELAGGLLLGGLVAVGFITQTVGLVITTPARSAFIVAISSVIAPIVALVAFRQRPHVLVAAALALAGLGMYLLTAPDAGGLNRGDVWTLGCAVAFGAQIVLVGELSRRHDGRRLLLAQFAGTAASAALALPLFERPAVHWTPGLAVALAYLVLGATVATFALQLQAQQRMSTARAALIFCAEPVFAALASWLLAGERLSAAQWTGGALILGAMLIAELPIRAS